MSRAQQGETFDQSQELSKSNASNAQTSENATQADIKNQQSQLAKFAADNPYVEGGQMETTTNRQLAGTADSTAAAAKAGNQQLAQRTGQNASTGVAAGEAEQQAAQTTLATQGAGATESRLRLGRSMERRSRSRVGHYPPAGATCGASERSGAGCSQYPRASSSAAELFRPAWARSHYRWCTGGFSFCGKKVGE